MKNRGMILGAAITLAATFSACQTGRVRSDWKVEITTSGGFTGRGSGTVAVSAATASGRLAAAVNDAQPERWAREYVEPANPNGYADQIRYTLSLSTDGRLYTTSWYDAARPLLPRDLVTLFEAAWESRGK